MNTKSSIVVLIVVVLIGGIIYVYGKDGASTGTSYGSSVLQTGVESREGILKRVATVEATPLTEKEKITLFESLSSDNSKKYGFTNEEKRLIIDALNK